MTTLTTNPSQPLSSGTEVSGTGLSRSEPGRRGPVLLALHGGEGTGVIEAAHALSGRLGVALKVVTVVEPVPTFAGAPDMVAMSVAFVPTNGDVQASSVRRLVGDTLGSKAEWTLETRFGSPAHEIASAARESDATMIVVDAAPRRGIRHVVAGIRALQVMSRSTCPVVSVASWRGLPRTIVAPIDFSPASIRAAQVAVSLAGDNARVILMHVPWAVPLRHVIIDHTGALMGGDVSAHFARVRAELQPLVRNDMTIETRTMDGSVVSAVLSVAESESADLVAAGTHGRGPVERFFVGSVAAGLLHGARCPVLVSPPPSAADIIRLELRMTGDASTDDPAAWRDVLAAASKRNAGRVVDVEVDDPAIGAQVQASGYVLRGIDYDPADHRVDVMLDAGPDDDAHLTRTITRVRSISIASSPAGQDVAIEIAQGRGHTLILFR